MRVTVEPLSVPTRDPFVIASGRVHATRSVLVRVELDDGTVGLGEGACLPPVTREDQADALAVLRRTPALDALDAWPVARAGLEMALLDARARQAGLPLWRYLGGSGSAAPTLETDVTLPILSPARMAALAAEWWQRGFRTFKVKAGLDLEADLARLAAVRRAAPDAVLQADANGGFGVDEALAYLDAGGPFRCLEQPCATAAELVAVAARTAVPIVADESAKSVADLDALAGVGVNLKIAKSGGLVAARAVGLEAQRRGLRLMVGGMVETKLGMTAAAHLAASLGGVDFVDLDTAFLLTEDPFDGGYASQGPILSLPETPGLGIRLKTG